MHNLVLLPEMNRKYYDTLEGVGLHVFAFIIHAHLHHLGWLAVAGHSPALAHSCALHLCYMRFGCGASIKQNVCMQWRVQNPFKCISSGQ